MALSKRSLFLYGFQVTEENNAIDFRAAPDETPRQATLRLGYYSLSSLMTEMARAISVEDSETLYRVTADRTLAGGLQNRVTITSGGEHFELLGASGPRSAVSALPLVGFPKSDHTGSLEYTGTSTCGTAMLPTYPGFNFMSPELFREILGTVNISASGNKEAIVYNTQEFWQVEFKYEPHSKIVWDWVPLMTWLIKQRLIEFTPDITEPETFYEGTLESAEGSSKGLGYQLKEMLPQFVGLYRTGLMKFRVRN